MFNIFLAVFFTTLAFACLEPYFFIGYLISIALFGLYQAIFMANAGGAWDNAKKLVEVELKEKGTPLHAATVVGDTVGDPVQGHLVGGDEPGHQVHDAVRPARRRARGRASSRTHQPACSSGVLPRWSRWSSCGARSTACASRPRRMRRQQRHGRQAESARGRTLARSARSLPLASGCAPGTAGPPRRHPRARPSRGTSPAAANHRPRAVASRPPVARPQLVRRGRSSAGRKVTVAHRGSR